MAPERWQRIEELYHSARERKPDERAAFLDHACQGDEELRREVESLLAQDSAREGILDRPAAGLLDDSTVTTLAAGARLGPYQIEASIGAGGMSEVFRAIDTRLGRPVAIKISREQFSGRFEREARAISSLNHPHICTLYDVGPNYLVLELVEGETLAALIKRKGALRIELVLRYGAQIAEALAEAHAKGITHRDLKPGNIMLTKSGVKVLDFGLARSQAEVSLTGSNAVIGTPAYMAPEQREGGVCDARTDIYALGLVMYEMVTGKRASETGLQSLEPSQLDRVVKTCLAPDPADRWQTAREFQIALRPLSEERTQGPARGRGGRWWLPWTAAAALLFGFGALAFIHFREKPPVMPVQRYTVAAPENSVVQSFAISPDGRYVVFAAAVNGERQLWLRALDALQAQPMPTTKDATYPFWSPDSRNIGFFAQNKLKKVAASGGLSQLLCDSSNSLGGSWGRDGVIVFSSGFAIQRVQVGGGVPVEVTKTKVDQWLPVFLPDGRRFLYMAGGAQLEKSGIYVSSLDGTENRRILSDVLGVVFAPPSNTSGQSGKLGHILFVRENSLMAQPFDVGSAQLAGDVFPVANGVGSITTGYYLPASVSDNGLLLYANGGAAGGANQIAWYDRTGKLLGPVGAPGQVFRPAISPDEKSVVYQRSNGPGADLWLRDLTRSTEMRFTSDGSYDAAPFWSPQGDRIVFASNRNGGVYNLFQKSVGGSGQGEALLKQGNNRAPTQWSRDGRFIVYFELDPKTKEHTWVLPMEESGKGRKPVPLLQTEFTEVFGQLSPDSRWMAYTSDQSGRREVYVRPFPSGEGQWTISAAGGQEPRWRGDGKELFYEAADGRMMAVPVKAAAEPKPMFEAGAPEALFDAQLVHNPLDVNFEYDVTADGKRFLINTASGPGAASPTLNVVVNWNAEAKR